MVNRTIFRDGVELSGNNFSEEVAFQLRFESVSQVKKDGKRRRREKRGKKGSNVMLEELKEVWYVLGVKFGRRW